ncbi:pseudouridine synthase deg1 [Fusarium irregulare]|uniref:Pseudouridine synthase deg1 n=1 Tax=Fusarium irregulare TaxID=2494466 RepID=A0A9W8PUT4_9HYPO|nr:pseudouridine synthase deg1 [Fusarium irregulare]KAJ4021861.1 pseudouridine synthase deg1 [Fusarium irregulare]
MSGESNYQSWTKNGLIQKVKELEAELRNRPAPEPKHENEIQPQNEEGDAAKKSTKPKGKRKMDPSKYSTRYIALKLAYLGKNYGGFEFQAMANAPSIEEELWNALTKACLIFPNDERVVDFECCEYSKCGRTDKGVSAFGQVIGLRVRSNRPLPKKRRRLSEAGEAMVIDEQSAENVEESMEDETSTFDPVKDELQYPRLLNRVLPPDIRILAWCPSPPPDFSARFSCRERQYRYFFTQPAFTPEPSAGGARNGWLDIEAMREAAKRYEGEHDFRNFCKIDPGKQITNFVRTIYETDIEEVRDVSSALPYLSGSQFAPGEGLPADSTAYPKVYSFNVRGSAFLWHQIRHMVAVLFLAGQRLEKPDIVTTMLDVANNPCKPNYVMADEVPLVLWDCIFPGENDGPVEPTAKKTDGLDWVYLADDPALSKPGPFGVMDGMWAYWRERKLDELLSNQLLQLVSTQRSKDPSRQVTRPEPTGKQANSVIVYEGGNGGRMGGRYVPLMKKDKLQSPEEQNERYAIRKGYASSEDMRTQKGIGKRKADEAMDE